MDATVFSRTGGGGTMEGSVGDTESATTARVSDGTSTVAGSDGGAGSGFMSSVCARRTTRSRPARDRACEAANAPESAAGAVPFRLAGLETTRCVERTASPRWPNSFAWPGAGELDVDSGRWANRSSSVARLRRGSLTTRRVLRVFSFGPSTSAINEVNADFGPAGGRGRVATGFCLSIGATEGEGAAGGVRSTLIRLTSGSALRAG